MSKYWQYFKYLIEHKRNVFKAAWGMGLYGHAFTHDLSKFLPGEFIPYAKYFYGNYPTWEEVKKVPGYSHKHTKEYVQEQFDHAWIDHYMRNKHHWDHWTIDWDGVELGAKLHLEEPAEMPVKYIKQMIADWTAMSYKFGGSAQEYYLKNYKKIKLNRNTRLCLEANLGLCGKWFCECDYYYWCTLEEIVDDCLDRKKENPQNFSDWFSSEFLRHYWTEYGVDLLLVLGKLGVDTLDGYHATIDASKIIHGSITTSKLACCSLDARKLIGYKEDK